MSDDSVSAAVVAAIGVEFRKRDDALKAYIRRREHIGLHRRILGRLYDPNVLTTLTFGGPREGKVWEVRYITVMDSGTLFTGGGVYLNICVGNNPDTLPYGEVVIPGGIQYTTNVSIGLGRAQVVVTAGEIVYVAMDGDTYAPYLASLDIVEFDADEYDARY